MLTWIFFLAGNAVLLLANIYFILHGAPTLKGLSLGAALMNAAAFGMSLSNVLRLLSK